VIDRLLERRNTFAQRVLRIGSRAHIDRSSGLANSLPRQIRQAAAMVVGDVRAEQLFVPELFQLHGARCTLEFGGNAQAEFPGQRPIHAVQPRKHPQGH